MRPIKYSQKVKKEDAKLSRSEKKPDERNKERTKNKIMIKYRAK